MVTPQVPPVAESRVDADVLETRLPHLLEAYRCLVRARALEVRWGELEQRGAMVPTPAEPGGDIPTVAAGFALGADDWVVGEGNEVALALLRGATLAAFVAHAFGRGPHPWHARARRTVASDWRNGAHVTQGVGVAWGAKIERRELAVLVTFADAIAETGEFHNGVNLAGVFKAPAIFLAVTRSDRPSPEPQDAEHAAHLASAYGISAQVCDGSDFFAVARAVSEARRRAVAGLGPTFLEARVPRAQALPQDTAAALRRHLEARGAFDPEREARLEVEAAAEIERAVTELGAGAAPVARHAVVLPESRIVVPTNRRPG
ncbi:thiamine pyrophosphate-dependent enzyme [Pendulispora albinea]|uniref:2-oxoisovalerate dehydrogenase subunit alpha n=1 Tax=Pendulispora albinea TaxID=2741071 RepID=A0ABZ2LNB4_9BACT